MTPWNAAVESIFHAIAKPNPVSVNEIRNIAASTGTISAKPIETPASGAKTRSISPCIHPNVADPKIFPSTKLVRGAGDTSIESKKPSRRSSMIEIVEKIAENITVSTRVPE